MGYGDFLDNPSIVHPSKALYRRAADIMELNGKAEQIWVKEDGRCCMGGAVMLAAHDATISTSTQAYPILVKPLHDTLNNPHSYVNWSDSHTKDECVAKLREIAETLE